MINARVTVKDFHDKTKFCLCNREALNRRVIQNKNKKKRGEKSRQTTVITVNSRSKKKRR